MSSTLITSLVSVNSTTYVDELGILVGLSRLPNETSVEFLRRIKTAVRINRSQSYIGILNEITLQLGLSLNRVISLSGLNEPKISASIAGVTIQLGTTIVTIPLTIVDIDDAWTWRRLSDIVLDINSTGLLVASLLVPDAPSLVLANQSNVLTVVAQSITGQNIDLGFTGILVGSERFNKSVPSYTLSAGGRLVFTQPVASGTQITYQRQIWPYNLIGGDVSIIGLLDPNLSTVAQGPNGTMVYQIREAIQTIASKDKSYWSK